jgi:toxin HigB-1
MEIEFLNTDLERLFTEKDYISSYDKVIKKAFTKVVTWIITAKDERDFYGKKSVRYEKLKGDRKKQHSMRLNDQYRLILEIVKMKRTEVIKVVQIVEITDYH